MEIIRILCSEKYLLVDNLRIIIVKEHFFQDLTDKGLPYSPYAYFGRTKNVNKNPVAEKANQELELEILKIDPSGKAISAITLIKAVCVLNTRIRQMGLSAKEMFFGRDQISGERLQFSDDLLGKSQLTSRNQNHSSSAKSKAKGGSKPPLSGIVIGSVVFVKQEGNKFKSRESYVVTDILANDMAVIQKMDSNKGFFSATKYTVPIDHLYMCSIRGSDYHQCEFSDSSTEGLEHTENPDFNDNACLSSSESESSVDEIAIPQSNNDLPRGIEDQSSSNSEGPPYERRSSRNRRRPERFGSSVEYDAEIPFRGETDTVDNWWPNFPRGSWSPNRGNL